MKLLVALLGLCFAGAVPALAETSAAPQPVTIRLSGDAVAATHLPSYDPQQPIAVRVETGNERPGDLSLVASGPAGRSLQVPLVTDAGDSYRASMTLADVGTWRLQLAATSGALRTLTAPILLEVAAPPPSYAAAVGWAVGVGTFVIFGCGGFALLRRAFPPAPPADLELAA